MAGFHNHYLQSTPWHPLGSSGSMYSSLSNGPPLPTSQSSTAEYYRQPYYRQRAIQDDNRRTINHRAKTSCEACRRKKTKCDEQQPCKNCIKNKAECKYLETQPTKGQAKGELKEIEMRIMEGINHMQQTLTDQMEEINFKLRAIDEKVCRLEKGYHGREEPALAYSKEP